MKLSPPTPELPVHDLRATQAYFRDTLGFDVAWFNEGGRIGAVAHGPCAVFLREVEGDIAPVVCWIFTEQVDAVHEEMVRRGADIVEPIEDKPWGLRQFTLRDMNGHLFHFHCD